MMPAAANSASLHYVLEDAPGIGGFFDFNVQTRSIENWDLVGPNYGEFDPSLGGVETVNTGGNYYVTFNNIGHLYGGLSTWYLQLEFTEFNRDALLAGWPIIYLSSYRAGGKYCNWGCTYPLYLQGTTGRINATTPVPEPASALLFSIGFAALAFRTKKKISKGP